MRESVVMDENSFKHITYNLLSQINTKSTLHLKVNILFQSAISISSILFVLGQ